MLITSVWSQDVRGSGAQRAIAGYGSSRAGGDVERHGTPLVLRASNSISQVRNDNDWTVTIIIRNIVPWDTRDICPTITITIKKFLHECQHDIGGCSGPTIIANRGTP